MVPVTTPVWHKRFTSGGDSMENVAGSIAKAVVALALLLLVVPGPAYGAVQIAGVLAGGLDPAKRFVIQALAGIAIAAAMVGVVVGIDRFNRRTPVVTR